MDLKQYRSKLVGSTDERAVSPVIGVILMVAITVILAAVIAAFVLDMGDPGNQSISASADIGENETGNVTVALTAGGENVDGIAFVNSSGEVTTLDTNVNSTGASGTYGTDLDGSGNKIHTADGVQRLPTGEYTIYAYQGNLDAGGAIDDTDANVEVGEASYTAP